MSSYRVLPIDRVIDNLSRQKYRGKIQSADYANTGIQRFDGDKFAGQLGISLRDLRLIGLVVVREQSGWKLDAEPSVEDLRKYRHILEALRTRYGAKS